MESKTAMNVTISKENLSKILFLTQNIVERKATMPILANVLLTAGEQKLKIAATDLEITVVTNAAAQVTNPGSITVNAKVFADVVRELPEGEVVLKMLDGQRLEISAQNSKLRIIGTSASEYPNLPGMSLDTKAEISSKQLLDMISKTIYAVSTDEARFNLNGVCFSTVGENDKDLAMRMVATDGHRLAMVTRPVTNIKISEPVIVPRKGLGELKKILDAAGDIQIKIDLKDGFFVVDAGDTKISMRLIDGEFPDYRQVVPKEANEIAIVLSADLIQALRRVALMVSDKAKCVKMDFAGNTLRVSSSSPELGDATEELAIKYTGEPVSIGFNARYLLDLASSFGDDQVLKIAMMGALGPGKFTVDNDDSCVGIVMPMRL